MLTCLKNIILSISSGWSLPDFTIEKIASEKKINTVCSTSAYVFKRLIFNSPYMYIFGHMIGKARKLPGTWVTGHCGLPDMCA